MSGVKIYLGQLKVDANHLHRRMTEHPLKRIRITAVPQILDRERVAKTVRMGICHPDSFTNVEHQLT